MPGELEPLEEEPQEEGEHGSRQQQQQQQQQEQRAGVTRQASSASSQQQHGGRTITPDMVTRAIEKQAPRTGNKAPNLAKQTHLHLNGHRIERIAGLQGLASLEVLYLYDNVIQVVEGLASLKRLTHLYLQNNDIAEIQGISGLPCLAKLYLQGNCIRHASELHNLPSLEELHLSNQRLAPGGPGMTFDMHSMLALSPTLRVLCAAGCGLGDEAVALLPPLPQLRKLDLSCNALEVVECLQVVVGESHRLQQLEVHGNPLCHDAQQRYRDAVTLMSDGLATLDGEAITQQQRSFLLRFQIQKLKHQVHAGHEEGGDAAGPAGAPLRAQHPPPGGQPTYPTPPQQRVPRGPGYSGAAAKSFHAPPPRGAAGMERQASAGAGAAVCQAEGGKVVSIPSKGQQSPSLSLGVGGLQIR